MLVASSGAGKKQRLGPAVFAANGLSLKGYLGSHCVSSEPDGSGFDKSFCADAAQPSEPPRRKLEVAPRNRLQITFGDNPSLRDDVRRLSVNLVRVEDGEYRFVGRVGDVRRAKKGRRWQLALPKKLHRANALDVFARFKGGGDANHMIGLRSRRRRTLDDCPHLGHYVPLKARELTGRRPRRARAVAREHGCELRVTRRNGKGRAITHDLRSDRVNVSVRDGRVKSVVGVF